MRFYFNQAQFEEVFQAIDHDDDRNLTKKEFLAVFDSRRSADAQTMAAEVYAAVHSKTKGRRGDGRDREDDDLPDTPNIVVEGTINFSNISSGSGGGGGSDASKAGESTYDDSDADSTFGDTTTSTSFGDNSNMFNTGFTPGGGGGGGGGGGKKKKKKK